ncbi:MAG: hypothetical protein Q9217_000496 [Psora testacea]
MASMANGSAQPVCQNCTTSTTPLWRRDESGGVLCNACGLFLKLHGTPRPISLKTDVIKSRNRVKTAGQQGQKRRSLFENGLPASQSEPNHNALNHRVTNRTSTGGSERSGSPLSRTNTPSLHHPPHIAPQHMFDGVSLSDHAFQPHTMSSIPLRQPSPGSTSSNNDRHLEPPQTFEGLLQVNSALKTRVNELEVINGLYQGTVRQYQQGQQPAPQADMVPHDTSELRQLLRQSQQREEELKRQVEDLEREVAELRGELPPAKRTRRSSGSDYPEPPQDFAANGLHS